MNRNWVYKTFWTAVAAVIGVVTTALADLPVWWAPIATTAATAGLAYVREQIDGLNTPT